MVVLMPARDFPLAARKGLSPGSCFVTHTMTGTTSRISPTYFPDPVK